MNSVGSINFKSSAAVAHQDGTVSIWDLNMRKCLTHQKVHQGEARGVSYSADGRFVASAGFDKNIVIADTMNENELQVVKCLEHDDRVVSVRWHPYLPLLISTSADKSARIWTPFGAQQESRTQVN